jgi:hemerythrin-like domain-containing protein
MKAKATHQVIEGRRQFLLTAASASGIALAGCATTSPASPLARPEPDIEEEEAEVTPGEDLMQEHGVLERILLLYGEAARRLEQGEPLDLSVVKSAADIIRRFVEDYHEKQEEEFVFPRLEAARQEVELVRVLRRQHQRGRELTEEIARLSSGRAEGPALSPALLRFERMYRPHAAREDTVLFPAFRRVVGGSAYRELGEQFEEREHERFGERGFENTVTEVARLEAVLNIADLAAFTA